ncbi:MAG TPA: type VI secretion system-associated protein TagF [Stellaceae bacterium]|jgi:type VI secretion system protein ImpM|nr:type VI secretion system-associated protein TagF [Stellaceae bacterium]
MADAAASGFCGKLPARADFVSRRLPVALVEEWHVWLAEILAAARAELGDDWLDCYLRGPIWRFALGAGIFAGTLMPSVDSVGRYFPLTIVRRFASIAALAEFAVRGAEWFAAAEAISLAALGDGAGLADIDNRVAALPAAMPAAALSPIMAGAIALEAPGLVVPLDPETAAPPFAATARRHLERGNSLWWTLGSERLSPVALLAVGRPNAAAFPAMFSGRWAAQGWREEPPLGGVAADFSLDKDEAAP